MVGLVGWVALFFLFAPDLPDTAELWQDAGQAKIIVLASDGDAISERGVAGRQFVELNEIAPTVPEAVIATEDRRFYSHFGLDVIGTARALIRNLIAGGYVQGGSTITQQLAKNLYLTPERSLRRKLEELMLSLWLEARLDKDQILTLYLNRVYFGAGAYGIEAAAQRYFNKPAIDLDLAESAMLVGLLKAPSRLAPTNDIGAARDRAAIVLTRMEEEDFITTDDVQLAVTQPASLADTNGQEMAAYFVDWVLDGLSEFLGKPEHDMIVRTTLDPELQRHGEIRVRQSLDGAGQADLNGALVLLDESGAVRAMVGGRSYRTSRFNRAVNAKRQPGSAFKPFVYAAALESGWEPSSVIDDVPFTIGDWQPRNPGGAFAGKVTLTEALARSINTVAVRLADRVGLDRVASTARRFGIGDDLREVPSLALGTSEVTLIDLTSAFVPFAGDGMRRPYFAVESVHDQWGRPLYKHRATEVPVTTPEVAKGMRTMLQAVVANGTGKAAALPDRTAAGKTGTTQDARDAWFVGFSGSYILGVWVGRDDNQPMPGINGGNLPATLWRQVMQATPPPHRAPAVVAGGATEGEPLLHQPWIKEGMNWIGRKVNEAIDSVVN